MLPKIFKSGQTAVRVASVLDIIALREVNMRRYETLYLWAITAAVACYMSTRVVLSRGNINYT